MLGSAAFLLSAAAMLLLPAILSKPKGVWKRLLEALIDEPSFGWLMINASYVKMPAHDTDAVGTVRLRGPSPSQRRL